MMRRTAALGWATVTLVGGCEQPRTELVVRLDSEVAWGAGRTVQSITLTVRRGGPTGPLRSTRTTALGMGGERRTLPLSVGILPGDDTDTPVWIEALGCGDPNGCTPSTAVVAQRAVVRFTRGQTEEVTLLLASACVGVVCGSDERCGEGGRCEPATRAMVRPFDGLDAGPVADVGSDAGGMDRPLVADAPVTDAGSPVDRNDLGVGADAVVPVDVPVPDVLGADSVAVPDTAACTPGTCGPMHAWSQRFGLRRTSSNVRAVAMDVSGNVYIGGQGASGTTFGGDAIVAPNVAAFVASFTSTGRFRWFRQLGTDGSVTALGVDTASNIYLAGRCQAAVNLGGGPLAGPATDTQGSFFGSLTADGGHRWSRRVNNVALHDVAVAGESLVAVGINGTVGVDFGGGTSTGAPSELFVASFALDGTHRWSRHFGANNSDPRIAGATDGALCIVGSHTTPLDFGNGPIDGDRTVQPFAACLAPSGAHRWSRRFESDGSMAYATGVATDAAGNTTITGLFERSIDLGGGPRRSSGNYDLFVASFDPSGVHRWSTSMGGSGIDGSNSIAADAVGNVVVTGTFQAAVVTTVGAVVSAGERDVFLAGFSPSGAPTWVRRFGDTADDFGFDVSITANHLAAVGVFIGDVDFGGGILTSVGDRDVFLIDLAR
jgi:hypothetical protein